MLSELRVASIASPYPKMTNEEKKVNTNLENSATNECEAISPICQKNCKVCSSDFTQEIHLMRKNGRKLSEIVAWLKSKYNFEISEASLSRHFTNYKQHLQLVSAKIMQGEIIETATKQAEHTEQVVSLIDTAIKQLKKRAEVGNLTFDVSDLEKLMKLRYQVLTGENKDETDILKIFQEAKVIFNQNQLRLI